jgi:hypothetical protein
LRPFAGRALHVCERKTDRLEPGHEIFKTFGLTTFRKMEGGFFAAG